MNETLCKTVKEMKDMGNMLVSVTFPKAEFKVEQEVSPLKQRMIVVDGYEILSCYSKADYGNHLLESLQVQAAYAPFLPFVVVCKLGRAFLGSDNLSYIEFLKNNKKVYCWTVKSRDGRLLPPDSQSKPGSFEGFEFNILQPGSVDLF